MTGFVLVSSIIISAGSLAWVYFEAGMAGFGRWVLIFGAAWLIAQWRGWKWFSYVGLSLAFLLSAAGLWFGLTPGWMFSGAIFALVAVFFVFRADPYLDLRAMLARKVPALAGRAKT